MTCAEFQEAVWALAIGALDPDEERAALAHLASTEPHQGCAQKLAEARRLAAAMDAALPPVPAGAWPSIDRRARREPRMRSIPWLVAASGWAVAAAAALFLLLSRPEPRGLSAPLAQLDRCEQSLSSTSERADRCSGELEVLRKQNALPRLAATLLGSPGAVVTRLAPASAAQTASAVSVYAPAEKRAVVLTSALQSDPQHALQLWVIRGKNPPVPAGFLQADASGVLYGEIAVATLEEEPDAFAVSREPPGGSAKPTEVLMLGRLHG